MHSLYRKYLKRLLDIILVLLGMVLFLPIMGVVAILVRIFIGKPILFKQDRPGLNEKIFTIYKFRTMKDAYDEKRNLLPDAIRLTKFGKFLRSTSLDELPELFNVLKGDMSLVGPRPLLVDYLVRYSKEQARRHEVRPGITGWAQVNGRNDIGWDEKFMLDVWYVYHCSFWIDLKIIVLTVAKVLRKDGVNKVGYATTSTFWGSEKDK